MNLDLQIFLVMIIIKEIFTASIILFAVIDIIGNIPLIISLRDKVGHIQSEKASIIAAIRPLGRTLCRCAVCAADVATAAAGVHVEARSHSAPP